MFGSTRVARVVNVAAQRRICHAQTVRDYGPSSCRRPENGT
jgi:hypothetical protein